MSEVRLSLKHLSELGGHSRISWQASSVLGDLLDDSVKDRCVDLEVESGEHIKIAGQLGDERADGVDGVERVGVGLMGVEVLEVVLDALGAGEIMLYFV